MAAKRLAALAGGALALLVAVAAWVTGGALTLTSIHPDASRIGILPSPVWLAAWVAVVFAARKILGATDDRFALLGLSIVVLAPWIPGSIPNALYIWTGPLRTWLWAIVIVGVAAPSVVRNAPRGFVQAVSDPRRAPWIAAAAAACAYAIGAHQVFPRLPTGDEPHYLIITQSLLRDHDLKIENNHQRGDYREYYETDLRPDYLRRGADGQIYSVHAPGLPLLSAPAFALFGHPGVVAFLALVSAGATALAWMAAWRVTSDAAASWFGWAAVALSAPFFFQSFVVYPDAPGAALIMVGVLALVGGGALSTNRLLATGAALAMLPWLHTRFVAAAVVLAVAIAARQWSVLSSPTERVRRAAALLSIPAASAICWFGFFYAIYGSPDPRAPYGTNTQSSLANLPRGIIGLIFDQQFGLLPTAPVFLSVFPGMAVLLRRTPRLGIELVCLAAPYVGVVGAYQMWWGGNSSPGRFIVPVLLPLAIPAAAWFRTHRGATARALGLGALTISLLATISLAATDRGMLIYNSRDGASRLLLWLSPLVNITTGLPSVFRTTPSMALLQGLVWLAAIGVTALGGLVVQRRRAPRAYVAFAVGFSAIVASSAALSIVWRQEGGDSTTPITLADGTTAFLRQYDPDSRQFAVRDRPLGRLNMDDALPRLQLADQTRDSRTGGDPQVVLLHVPAGDYAIEATGAAGDPDSITAGLERGPAAPWAWRWATPGASPRVVRLPVAVPLLSLVAEHAQRLVVRPVAVLGSRHRVVDGEAVQAVRYGASVVYLMRGQAYLEEDGMWIEGANYAEFVVAHDEAAPPRLFVRNPLVDNELTIEGDGWREHRTLKQGEEDIIPLPVPVGSNAWRMRVTAARGARPSDIEHGSRDSRFLGCWIEIRS